MSKNKEVYFISTDQCKVCKKKYTEVSESSKRAAKVRSSNKAAECVRSHKGKIYTASSQCKRCGKIYTSTSTSSEKAAKTGATQKAHSCGLRDYPLENRKKKL